MAVTPPQVTIYGLRPVLPPMTKYQLLLFSPPVSLHPTWLKSLKWVRPGRCAVLERCHE